MAEISRQAVMSVTETCMAEMSCIRFGVFLLFGLIPVSEKWLILGYDVITMCPLTIIEYNGLKFSLL